MCDPSIQEKVKFHRLTTNVYDTLIYIFVFKKVYFAINVGKNIIFMIVYTL